MHRLLIPALAIVASCYRPQIEGTCVVRCDPATAPLCPSGLACGADGFCFDERECSELGDDAGLDDAQRDASIDTSAADCYTTLLLDQVCPASLRMSYVPGSVIDTDTDCDELLSQADGSEACLIATDTVTLQGTIAIRGARPLVLFARGPMLVPGTTVLDISLGGAGVGVGCEPPANGSSNGSSNGGGGGGSLAGQGGAGGPPAGGASEMTTAGVFPTMLRGGCNGGNGALGAGSSGGRGGLGGGGLQLISRSQIQIEGRIDAWGAGGAGASGTVSSSGGGGSGGSGGLVALDSPTISFGPGSMIRAHGGGGGGGAQGSATAGSGGPGSRSDGMGAARGVGVGNGCGDGGAGSADATPPGALGVAAMSGSAAGGGGGGGAGIILLSGSTGIGGMQHPIPIVLPPST